MSDLKEAAVEPVAATVVVQKLQHVLKDGGSELTIDISDLKLYESQLIYVCGKNGTGKSTLFKLLALQFHPNEKGYIRVLDKTFPASSDQEEADQRGRAITYIPQGSLGLDGDKTPLETIRDVLWDYDRHTKSDASRCAEEALHKVKLGDDKFHKRIKKLSGGEQARVAVAKAYARKRAICLADEILSALDDDGQKLTLQIFQELVLQEHCTIAIIVHEPGELIPEVLRNRELLKYFHRVLLMECSKMNPNTNKSISKIRHDETTVPVLADVSDTPGPKPSPSPSPFHRWASPLLSIAFTALVLFDIIWQLPDTTIAEPAACIVPNIVGLDKTAASMALSSLGLEIVESVRYDSKIAAGTVLSQEPTAGTKLRPCQGEVTMEISLGPTPPPVSVNPPPTEFESSCGGSIQDVNGGFTFPSDGCFYRAADRLPTEKYELRFEARSVNGHGYGVWVRGQWNNGSPRAVGVQFEVTLGKIGFLHYPVLQFTTTIPKSLDREWHRWKIVGDASSVTFYLNDEQLQKINQPPEGPYFGFRTWTGQLQVKSIKIK